jgi:hypothetical protein
VQQGQLTRRLERAFAARVDVHLGLLAQKRRGRLGLGLADGDLAALGGQARRLGRVELP